jgi:hypothetical protein
MTKWQTGKIVDMFAYIYGKTEKLAIGPKSLYCALAQKCSSKTSIAQSWVSCKHFQGDFGALLAN